MGSWLDTAPASAAEPPADLRTEDVPDLELGPTDELAAAPAPPVADSEPTVPDLSSAPPIPDAGAADAVPSAAGPAPAEAPPAADLPDTVAERDAPPDAEAPVADAPVAPAPVADVTGGPPPDTDAPDADAAPDTAAPDAGTRRDAPAADAVPGADEAGAAPPEIDAVAAGDVPTVPAVPGAAAARVDGVGAPVDDEVPTVGTPDAAARDAVPCAGAADPARPAAPTCADEPPAVRPEPVGPTVRAEDPAAADAAADAAESAATAATAAVVGATERRTGAVGSASVPCDWNIRRASVRRTALASGRCAGEGSDGPIDDPTTGPRGAPNPLRTSAAPPDAPEPPAPAPSSALRVELGSCNHRVRCEVPSSASVAASSGADAPADADGSVVVCPVAAETFSVDASEGLEAVDVSAGAVAERSAPGAPAPVAEGSAPGAGAPASRDDRRTSAGALDGAEVMPIDAELGAGPTVAGVPVRGVRGLAVTEAVTGETVVVGRGEAPDGTAAPEVDRRTASGATVGDPPDADEGRARAAAPPPAARADVEPRRESTVAVARARRRSSRPDGAGRALDPGGSVAAEGARSPVTADDARPGPPSFPGRAGGPARVAGDRMTRASDFMVIVPAARTSSETRTGIVVGARRVVLPPGR
ncbi:hypothetical protein ASD16_11930 [Cellulomonas sp. Root485]|uniref:hypothetical protein n=1 Tax=Cellulomonas sp. Root485 TaxID=1736546 RepID=UPI0006FFFEF0|nr:hypothetical protein [Cellulomonas sp. Root485]KQY23259.1 hypothetical protein ASD16_11930 [Cellulomonas sp. Root485]